MRTTLLCLLFTAVSILCAQEVCDNGLDDDGDGLFDIQDPDCSCAEAFPGVTADFEEFSCCPTSFTNPFSTGFGCVNDGWTFLGQGTTDYFNTCGYLGGDGILPVIPTPIPSGNGAMGIFSISSSFPYDEPIARCLDCSFIAGETYDVSFFVGFAAPCCGITSGDVEITIFGKADCSNIPGSTLGCAGDAGWTELATFPVSAVTDSWVEVTGSFTSPGNFSAVALGKSCAFVNSFNFASEYHYIDNLEINGEFSGPNCGSSAIDASAQAAGDCTNGYTLFANAPEANQFQWYIDGVAIPGATTNPWPIDPPLPGDYQVLATSPDGLCAISDPINFNPDLNTLMVDSDVTNPGCAGETNGSIDLIFSSPNPPFDINWDTGDNDQTLTNLGAGTYNVTVTDANGCFGEQTITLEDPEQVTSDIDVNQPIDENGGSVMISTTGGSGPYTYDWDNGLSGPDQSGLNPGTYTVTVTDANGCEEILVIEINDLLEASSLVFDETCFGQCEGAITLDVEGGQAPYDFNWNIPGNTSVQLNLCAGNYAYTVTDANGTEVSGSASIQAGILLEAGIVQDGVRCDNTETTNLDLTVNNGQAPFSYNWSTGANTEDVLGVGTGFFSVTIEDGQGCQAAANIQVLPVVPLQLNSLVNDISCDNPEGSIVVVATGGTNPIDYLWGGGQINNQLNDIPAGDYSLTVTDANGCTAEGLYTVEEFSQIASSAVLTQPDCANDTDGAIDLTIDSGTAPFDFSWSTSEDTEDIENLAPGDYTVTVSDASDCESVSTFTIASTSVVDVQAMIDDVSCLDGNDGAIDLTTSGSLPPLNFNWSTNENTPNISELDAGTYELTVTDAGGCTYEFSYEVTEPGLFVIDSLLQPNACFGDSAAAIEIIPVTPGSYAADWNTGAEGLSLTGLGEGDYAVTVTSDAACVQTYSFTLSDDNPALETNIDQVQPSCGDANGSLTLLPTGGVGPYTFNWETGTEEASIDNLVAGNYAYTVTDAVGCTLIGQTDLDEESTTTLTSTVIQPTCIDAENGSIDLNIANGTPPFDVSWSNGDSGPLVANLGAGQYTAEVVDANGCTLIREFTLAPTSSLTLDAIVADVTCFEGTNGTVTTSANAGLPPLSYSWSNSTSDPDLTNVPAGNYGLTITDAANCTFESSYDVGEPNLFVIDSLIDLNDCFGDSTASIQIVPPATGSFTADWNTGDAGLALVDLSAGSYSVVVSNDLGCEQAYDFTIEDPNPALVGVSDLTSPTCEEDNGSISLAISGGQGPYTIDWDNTQSGPVLNDLAEGNYQFTVTDGLGCTLIEDVLLSEVELGSFTSLVNQPTCPGATNGGVELTLSGVAEPFDIQWSNTVNGPVVADLGEGPISVEIIDANGCVLIESFDLEEQSSLTLSSTVADADCFGGEEGSIGLVIVATQEPLDFNWSNSGVGPNLDQLGAGTYDLTITDALGCEYESSYEITEPDEFIIDSLITLNDCFGGSEASIEITPPATGSYTAEWNTTDVGLSLTNLQAGDYSVSITSNLGCIQEYTFELVDEVPPIVIELVAEDPICGLDNGSLSATVDGGNGPFDFDWGTAGSGANLTGLADGDYALIVTDQTGCTATIATSLSPYPELTNASELEEPLCAGDATGSIQVTPNGGTGPYTFSWSNTGLADEINNLMAGDYEVTITDALGCELTESYTIDEPSPLALIQNVTMPLCFGDLGSVAFVPSGGSGAYTFSGDISGASLTYDLPAGQYDFELLDANNCVFADQINIVEPDLVGADVINTVDPDLGVDNGEISATANGGTPPYTFEWSNGEMGADIDGLGPGTYTATITDANGCQTTTSAMLQQPEALSFSIGSTNNLCAGTCTGTISLQLAGGTAPYTITWTDGQSGPTATDLCNGEYRAEIIDVNGNSISTDFVTISSPESLTVSSSIDPVSCVDSRDGSISTSVLGGTLPYSFSWNGVGGGANFDNLEAGTYELNIVDGNGCPFTQSFVVPDYEVRDFDFTSEVVNCDWDEYEIRILTSGFQDLDWLLDNDEVNVDQSGTIRGISPGAYTLSYREQTGCEVELEDFLFDGLEPYFLLVDESPREVEFGDQLQLEVLASPVDQLINEGTATWSSINPFSCIDGPAEACQQIELTAEISEVVEFSYRDDRGCLEVFRIPVFVAEPDYVYVPNAFSPNLDGINDELTIFTTDFVRAISSVQVYDRWGNMAFENYDLPSGEVRTWDGAVSGQPANSGVYVYMITLELVTGEEVLLSGDVTLVR